jgi:hypothetical protein
MILGGALFIWTNGSAAWIAARLSRRLLPRADFATRFLAGWIVFVGLTQLCLQLLGWLGAMTAVPLAVLMAVLVVVTALLGPSGQEPDPTASGSRPGRLTRVALVGAGVTCLWSLAAVVTGGVKYGWDTLTYHALSPAWWIQHGSLALPPFNYQAYYPMNVELHAAWFMLPFGSDAHANLNTVSWLAILVAACALHARILRQRTWLACATLGAMLLSPEIHERLSYFTAGDLALAAVLLAMLAFTWVPDSERRGTARALLCGLAGGLALGMKPTAAPLITMAGMFWIWRGRQLDGGLRHVAGFTAGVLLLGAPWYLRNLLLTGNPFFPAEIGPFEGPFTAEAQRATSLVPGMLAGLRDPGMWTSLGRGYLDWPLGLGLAAAVGYLAGLWRLVRTRDPIRRAHITLMLMAGLGFIALFPLSPFSGTTNRPDGQTIHFVRYLTFWFLTGLVLLPCVFTRSASAPRAKAPPIRLPRAAVPLALLLVLVGIVLSTPSRERAATFNLPRSDNNRLHPGWAALEELPDGARVAVTSLDPPSHSLAYPLLGRRLQHAPVAINLDGTQRRLLHETWREQPDDWWWEFDASQARPPPERLLRNLRETGVDYLLLNEWPRPRSRAGGDLGWAHLEARWTFQRLLGRPSLFTDGYSVLWDIRPKSTLR